MQSAFYNSPPKNPNPKRHTPNVSMEIGHSYDFLSYLYAVNFNNFSFWGLFHNVRIAVANNNKHGFNTSHPPSKIFVRNYFAPQIFISFKKWERINIKQTVVYNHGLFYGTTFNCHSYLTWQSIQINLLEMCQ